MTWVGTCWIEEAGRRGAKRCAKQCSSCAEQSARVLTSIETLSERYFDYDNVRPEDICLGDIAMALAIQSRFAGHIRRPYSIAEHAVRVSNHVAAAGGDAELQLAALHHDSHEAYILDIPTPFKRWFEAHGVGDLLRGLADTIDKAIGEALGVPAHLFKDPRIKEADNEMFFREGATLKKSKGVGVHWGRDTPAKRLRGAGLTYDAAREQFLDRHKELT